jgi:hypothetical protein
MDQRERETGPVSFHTFREADGSFHVRARIRQTWRTGDGGLGFRSLDGRSDGFWPLTRKVMRFMIVRAKAEAERRLLAT